MTRRVPIFSTIIVLAAVATMVALGLWQLGRKLEKETLITRYQAALLLRDPVPWPQPGEYEAALFRLSSVNCQQVRGIDSISGKSANGRPGWVHVARCSHAGGGVADVTIGWSRIATAPEWTGGVVEGRIASYGDNVRLIASEPQAGLEAMAKPDPADLPNNHLSYAGQWFFFALTALVIYVLAIRRRQR